MDLRIRTPPPDDDPYEQRKFRLAMIRAKAHQPCVYGTLLTLGFVGCYMDQPVVGCGLMLLAFCILSHSIDLPNPSAPDDSAV